MMRYKQKLIAFYNAHRKAVLIGSGILVVLFVLNSIMQPSSTIVIDNSKDDDKTRTAFDELKESSPSFKTLTPDGKTGEELGGWRRVSPEGKSDVYGYIDTINDIRISVSQQPLPQAFVRDPKKAIDEFATINKATAKVSTKDTTAYLATYSGSTQSIFFVRDSLLVLINAKGIVSNDAWARYIDSLKLT